MSDDLTDEQVALLCDIGEYDPSKQTEEKNRNLDRLVAEGFVQPRDGHPAFKLTAKGAEFLGKRGAGLNEA